MAVAITQLTQGGSGTNLSSYATASVTPTANALILCAVVTSKSGTPDAPTLTGNGLTWEQVRSLHFDNSGTQYILRIFRAMGAAPTAGAITIDYGGTAQAGTAWVVAEATGVRTTGTNGSGAIEQVATSPEPGTSGTSLTPTLDSPVTTGNAVWAVLAMQENETVTGDTGWTLGTAGTHSGPTTLIQAQHKIASDDASAAFSWATANVAGAILLEIAAMPETGVAALSIAPTAVPAYSGGIVGIVPELWRADISGAMVEDISALAVWEQSGIDMNIDRSIRMACNIRLRQPDRITPYSDYLAPFLTISYEDDRPDTRHQLGLYAIRVPPSEYTKERSEAVFAGEDMTSLAFTNYLTDTFTIHASAQIAPRVRLLLQDAGLTKITIPSDPTTIGTAMTRPPGTNLGEFANELLGMLGWYTLHADLTGRVTTTGPLRDPAQVEPVAVITDADIRSATVIVQPSELQVINVGIAINENNTATPMVGIHRNDNPDSPTGTMVVGERVAIVRVSGETTQAALNRQARLLVSAGKSFYRTASIAVLPNPELLIPHQIVELDLTGEMAELSGRWHIRTASMGLSPQTALTRLELAQVTRFSGEIL